MLAKTSLHNDQTHRRYLLYNELEIGRALNPVH